MPVLVTCSCGKQLRVPDEYVGKRIKCPACGVPQAIQGSSGGHKPIAPPTRSAAPSTGMIRFVCHCGKEMQARAEFAGRSTRCPACGSVQEIPKVGRVAGPVPQAGIQAARPSVRNDELPTLQPATEDDDGEDRPVKKARRRKKKASSLPWVVGGVAALLLLLVGGGLGAWWLFSGGPTGDLALVPGDAQGFVTVRVADVWKSASVQDVVKNLPKEAADGLGNFEKEFGLSPADVERVTMVFRDIQRQQNLWVIVSTSKPVDRKKIMDKMELEPTENKYEDRVYYQTKDKQNALCFDGDKRLILGNEVGVKGCLFQIKRPNPSGPLAKALATARENHHLVGGFWPPPGQLKQLQQMGGPQANQFKVFMETQLFTLTMDVRNELEMDLGLGFASGDKAKEAKEAFAGLKKMVQGLMGFAKMTAATKEAREGMDRADQMLEKMVVEQQGSDLHLKMSGPINATDLNGALTPLLQQSAAKTNSSNNLKQLALAMHNYHDANGHLPPAVIYSKDGKKRLYSWRVELLPYLGEEALYKEIHKDEPWNSPHNKTLWNRRPKVFTWPGMLGSPEQTFYKVFTGSGTPFADKQGSKFTDFADGTSNTVLIVEAAFPCNWMEPEDIPFNQAISAQILGSHFGNVFQAAMADGSVKEVPRTVTPATLKAAITHRGGEALGPDWPR